jgi:signal transduction histidine kinase
MDAIKKNEPFHHKRLLEDVTQKYYDLATWPMLAPDGQSQGSILLSFDVTERVLLDRQRDDFVATLAHDLQTPVIASDRLLSLLLSGFAQSLSADQANLISMLKRNNENLLHMIESLLDMYHYEEGASAMYFDEVDVRLLIKTCVEDLSPLAEQQGLLLLARPSRKPVTAISDRTALHRVLTNLIDNAIKFTPHGGTVEIGATSEDPEVVIEVTDTGCGITEEDQRRIFERYWHSRGKTHKASRGLGLYLCRQIVDAHGGRIECKSEPGKFTTFTVHLPLVRPAQDARQPAHSTSAAKSEAS